MPSSVVMANNHAKSGKDTRQTIVLTEEEREIVLFEMRSFLEAVQTIVGGLAANDLAIVTKSAKKVGFVDQEPLPATLKKKLPKDFKILGMKTHKAFDQLAMDTKEMEDKQQTLEQLGALMKNCVSCHAMFKFKTDK